MKNEKIIMSWLPVILGILAIIAFFFKK